MPQCRWSHTGHGFGRNDYTVGEGCKSYFGSVVVSVRSEVCPKVGLRGEFGGGCRDSLSHQDGAVGCVYLDARVVLFVFSQNFIAWELTGMNAAFPVWVICPASLSNC